MKGIILAGGTGSRLHPLTTALSKQLLPVYNKPMIYYPLNTLINAGVKEVLVITTPRDQAQFMRFLGTGGDWGIKLSFAVQEHANGIAEALIIAKSFIDNDNVALVLGDNLIFGPEITPEIEKFGDSTGALIFAMPVDDPERFGVVEFSQSGEPLDIIEKPTNPRSKYAIPGVYIFDKTACLKASQLVLSPRGELEITDIQKMYLREKSLRVHKLTEKTTWFDAGTFESLYAASSYVRLLQEMATDPLKSVEGND